MNAERIAQREADKAAAAAEAAQLLLLESQKETAKRAGVEAGTAQQLRARESAMKEAAAKLADLKLPSNARWGATAAATAVSKTPTRPPTSMADIFADQKQEEEVSIPAVILSRFHPPPRWDTCQR